MLGEKWRHKKRGVVYEIIADSASIQCAAAPDFEEMFGDDDWIVYRGEASGAWWVRPKAEFLDGRFERVEN
jgi:hypothetical protein